MDQPKLSRRGLMTTAAAAAAVAAVGSKADAAEPDHPEWSKRKKYHTIDGVRMAYYEVGQGDPIVFLHGNPTSSYLWRNIIPHVEHLGRCIAPDLVGMGDSEKLPNSGPGVYTFQTHRRYLFPLLEALGVNRHVVLVVHDWGSGLGFNWAHMNEAKVKGIAHMESLFVPPDRDVSQEKGSPFFQRLRSSEGEKLVLEENVFVEWFFTLLDYYLTEEDKAEYLRPYVVPGESRRPTLTWPRELPINNVPARNAQIMRAYSAWLAQSDVPKLFLHALPGLIFRVDDIVDFVNTLPNQKRVRIYGGHFVQEVSPDAIGRALLEWIPSLT